MCSVSLILPPGWTLHPGGPHIALPLLKGFLESFGIETHLHDLNIEAAHYYGVAISDSKIRDVFDNCHPLPASSMDNLYFKAEDQLQKIAASYEGTWYAHEGFRRNSCTLSSPEDIKRFSQLSSPFTTYFKTIAIPKILEQNPLIIGITLIAHTQILQAFELARLIRNVGYTGCIVLGGNVITRLYNDMALNWVFDIVDGIVTLQGEQTLKSLHECIKMNKSWAAVPNLMWRDGGQIVKNLSVTLKQKEFAQPDYSGMPVGKYWGTNYLTMVASRGCYYGKCSFCAIPFGYGKDGYIGSSPAIQVINSMKRSTEVLGIHRYQFIDEAIHPKMMRDLADIIIAEDLNFSFEAFLRLETAWTKPQILQSSVEAGLKKVYLGFELITSDGRDLLRKSDNADPLLLLKSFQDAGIKTHLYCMFGFPGTGIKEASETVDFCLKHNDLIDTLDIIPFHYARHTRVDGVTIIDEDHTTWRVEHNYIPSSPSTLSTENVTALTNQLKQLAHNEHPQWFHPVYRMYSPWN